MSSSKQAARQVRSREVLAALVDQAGGSRIVAGDAGMSRSAVNRLIAGHSTSALHGNADKLAEVLGVPTDVLFVPSQSPIRRRIDAETAKAS